MCFKCNYKGVLVGVSLIMLLICGAMITSHNKLNEEYVNRWMDLTVQEKKIDMLEEIINVISLIKDEEKEIDFEYQTIMDKIGVFFQQKIPLEEAVFLHKYFNELNMQVDLLVIDYKNNILLEYTRLNKEVETYLLTEEQIESKRETYKFQTQTDSNNSEITLIWGITHDNFQKVIKENAQRRIENFNKNNKYNIYIYEIQNGSYFIEKKILAKNNLVNYLFKGMVEVNAVDYPVLPVKSVLEEGLRGKSVFSIDSNEKNDVININVFLEEYSWIIGTTILEKELYKKYVYFEESLNILEEFNKEEKVVLIVVTITLLLWSNIVSGIILSRKKSRKISQYESEYLKVDTQNKLLNTKYTETNRILHDIKNHLVCLNGIAIDGNDTAVVNYIAQIYQDIHNLSHIIITGNKLIDIIISGKMEKIINNKIDLTYDIRGVNLDFIQDKDLTVIISNILDNAIESCIRSESKYMNLNIKEITNEFVVIKVINSCDQKPVEHKGAFLTTKENKAHHGYGLKNVEKVLDKYQAIYSFKYEEEHNMFVSDIIIPIVEKSKKALN